jgi:hypothetical protein
LTPISSYSRYIYGSTVNSNWQIGIWLLYATGHTVIAGALNISHSVATIYILGMLGTIANSQAQPAKPSPAAATAFAAEAAEETEVSVNPLASATRAQTAWAQDTAK